MAAQLPLSDAKARGADLDRLTAMGAAVLRRDFTWADIEPSEGQFDFSAQDAAVDATGARGIATVGILDYNAPWDAPDHDTLTPPQPQKFAAFAAATAKHFAGRVAAWEVWNEQNSGFRFWKPAPDPAAYADLLVAAAAAIRAADPAAMVLFGGLYYAGIGTLVEGAEPFILDAYAHRPDLGGSYDAMAIHPYPAYPPESAPDASSGQRPLGLMLARVRAALGSVGDGAKPVWVTEYGWPTYGAVDEATQARFLVRGAIEALAAGADRVCAFTLIDGPHPEAFPPEDAFGVVRNDGTPKRAYAALSWLARIDPTAKLAADESSGPVRIYRFEGKSPFRVLFATDGQTHAASVAGAEIRDVAGQLVAGSASALSVGGDPIYVR